MEEGGREGKGRGRRGKKEGERGQEEKGGRGEEGRGVGRLLIGTSFLGETSSNYNFIEITGLVCPRSSDPTHILFPNTNMSFHNPISVIYNQII